MMPWHDYCFQAWKWAAFYEYCISPSLPFYLRRKAFKNYLLHSPSCCNFMLVLSSDITSLKAYCNTSEKFGVLIVCSIFSFYKTTIRWMPVLPQPVARQILFSGWVSSSWNDFYSLWRYSLLYTYDLATDIKMTLATYVMHLLLKNALSTLFSARQVFYVPLLYLWGWGDLLYRRCMPRRDIRRSWVFIIIEVRPFLPLRHRRWHSLICWCYFQDLYGQYRWFSEFSKAFQMICLLVIFYLACMYRAYNLRYSPSLAISTNFAWPLPYAKCSILCRVEGEKSACFFHGFILRFSITFEAVIKNSIY